MIAVTTTLIAMEINSQNHHVWDAGIFLDATGLGLVGV